MNLNTQNQGYWFVLREDQSNVIFSSNSFTIQNPQRQEARYIVDTGDREFIQINEAPVAAVATLTAAQEASAEQGETNKQKDDNFWDRSKIKLLLTLCLENNFKNASKDKSLLEDIAAHLGTSPDECSNKYKNLRRTFIRLLRKKRQGKEIKWVHYNICEKVFSECKTLPTSVLEPWDDYKIRTLLTLYIENLTRFRSTDCLQKDVWKDIASQIGTTEYNCYHKFKNLKRAYFNWTQRSRETGKPIKWLYHQYFERINYDYTPNTSAWNRNKTRQLMDAYLQMADKFRNPKYQKKDLWKEISMIVDESAHSCDKKFRNLKQTYLKLKMRADSGRSITQWRYYKDFEAICSPYWGTTLSAKSQGEDYIKQLLEFCVENKEEFRNPRNRKKHVWRLLGPKIGLTSEGCDRKFRNLKQTFLRLSEKKKLNGYNIRWPYFSYFEKIFDEPIQSKASFSRNNIENISTFEMMTFMQQVQDKKVSYNFDKLLNAVKESNNIQKERNRILQALLDRR